MSGQFDGLKFVLQYRRKDDGIRWHNMAAFDGELAADRYFRSQDTSEDWPWEYQLVDIEAGTVTKQIPADPVGQTRKPEGAS